MLENYPYYLKALINLSIAICLIIFIYTFCKFILKYLLTKRHNWFKPIVFKGNEIISSEKLATFVASVIKVLRLLLIIIVLSLTLPFILQEIPETHDYSISLLESLRVNFMSIVEGMVEYIPSLFFIGLVIFICRSLIRFFRFLFLKIENEDIQIDGFYADIAAGSGLQVSLYIAKKSTFCLTNPFKSNGCFLPT